MDLCARESGGEGGHGPFVQARHHRQQDRGIDAPGKKHAVRHIRALMHPDRVIQQIIKPHQGIRPAQALGRAFRQGRHPVAPNHPALLDDQGFPRQHPFNPGEGRFPAGGELHLQHLVPRHGIEARRRQPGADQRLRFRREGEGRPRLGEIQRLDPERVAGQHQAAARTVVNGDGVHAAQMVGEAQFLAQVKLQRDLAVGPRFERHPAQVQLDLDVIIDFAVGDQDRLVAVGPLGGDRLIARFQVNDRQPRLDQAHIAVDMTAVAVRPAMGQGNGQRVENPRRRGGAVSCHDACDTAHGMILRQFSRLVTID